MPNKTYTVERTAPTVYQDNRGKVVEGYRVDVVLYEFDEGHSINVPTLDPETVKKAIDDLLAKRRKLADLGA